MQDIQYCSVKHNNH